MLNNPVEDQGSQLRKLQERWLALPLSYRVNALLYLGGGLLLVFLVITIIAGGDSKPRPIQVGAGANNPTTVVPRGGSVQGGGPVTTLGGPTSSTSSTTPVAPTATAPRVTNQATIPANLGAGSGIGAGAGTGAGAGAGADTGGDTGADGGGGGGGAEETTTTTAPPDTTTTTAIEIKPCRDSQESRCGNFSWDPAPAPNQPLTIGDVRSTSGAARAGQPLVFEVAVSDPDHLVSDYCAQVRYSDGGNNDGPCSPSPPQCPPHYGPWSPPERKTNTFTARYTHTFAAAGSYTVTMTFRSWSSDRCLGLDPYASESTRTVRIDVGT